MSEGSKPGDYIRDKGPDVVDGLSKAADTVIEQATIALEQLKDATAETREKVAVKFAEAARSAADKADKAAADARAQAEEAAKAAEAAREAVTVEVAEEAADEA